MISERIVNFRKMSLLLLAMFLVVVGCKSDAASAGDDSTVTSKATASSAKGSSMAELISAKIVSGDFSGARKLLGGSTTHKDAKIGSLVEIISEYEVIADQRDEARQKAYKEQFEKIEEIRAKDKLEDVNDIAEAFVAVIKAKGLANEEQKKAISEMDFVKQLVASSLEKAKAFEQEGKWVDSYSNCYYWLTAMYEDNQEYKDHADKLTEKAMIELSLKDNSCETSIERHEGIKADMLDRSIKALDINYVSVINYGDMAKKGLRRCKLLGEVMAGTQEELAYSAEKENYQAWKDALDELSDGLEGAALIVSRDKFMSTFEEVLAINSVTLKLPEEVVVAQFSEASLEALDPFTTLVWPWQVKDFQKSMTQNFTGIGVQISKVRGVLTVGSLLPDTPAFTSGLDANDQILAVNGEKTKDMTLQCAVSKITGQSGTEVTLTIRHEGDAENKTEDITIKRGRIVVATIRGWQRAEAGKWLHIVDEANNIGYVRLTGFTETTAKDLDNILKGLESKGMKGLVIDLRFNSGGYLQTAADVVDMFVEKGLIVKSQPRWGIANYEMAEKGGTHPNYPVVVLINGQSASASEIVAGALQDEKYKRATLVGEQSYGKGSVQTITPYSGGDSQLKYTMAYYHLPSGQRVKNRYVMEKQGRKDWGIAPDVKVEMRNDELREMLDVQLANDVLTNAKHDDEANPVKRYSLEETLEADRQLAVGILVIKSKIVEAGGTVVTSAKKTSGKTEAVVKAKDV